MAWLKYVGITMDKKVETVTMDRGVGVQIFFLNNRTNRRRPFKKSSVGEGVTDIDGISEAWKMLG